MQNKTQSGCDKTTMQKNDAIHEQKKLEKERLKRYQQ